MCGLQSTRNLPENVLSWGSPERMGLGLLVALAGRNRASLPSFPPVSPAQQRCWEWEPQEGWELSCKCPASAGLSQHV